MSFKSLLLCHVRTGVLSASKTSEMNEGGSGDRDASGLTVKFKTMHAPLDLLSFIHSSIR